MSLEWHGKDKGLTLAIYAGEQDVSLSTAGMPVSVLTWTAQLSTKSNGHAYL